MTLLVSEGVFLGVVRTDADRRLVIGIAAGVLFVLAVRPRAGDRLWREPDPALLVPLGLVFTLGALVLLRQRPDYPWLYFGTDHLRHFSQMSFGAHDHGIRYTALVLPHALHWAFGAAIGSACRSGTALRGPSGTSYIYTSSACSPDALVRYYVESAVVLWGAAMLALSAAAAMLAPRNRLLAAGVAAVAYASATFFAQPLLDGSWNALGASLLIALGALTWSTTRDGDYADTATLTLGALLVMSAHIYPTVLPFLGILWLPIALRARRSVAIGVAVAGIALSMPALVAMHHLGAGYVNTPGGARATNWPLCVVLLVFAAVAFVRQTELRPYVIPAGALGLVFFWAAAENLHEFGHLQYYAIRTFLLLVVALLPISAAGIAGLLPLLRVRLEVVAAIVLAVPVVVTFDLARRASSSADQPGSTVALVIRHAGVERARTSEPVVMWQNDLHLDGITPQGWLVVFGHSPGATLTPPTAAARAELCGILRNDPLAMILTPSPDVVSRALAHGGCDLQAILAPPSSAR